MLKSFTLIEFFSKKFFPKNTRSLNFYMIEDQKLNLDLYIRILYICYIFVRCCIRLFRCSNFLLFIHTYIIYIYLINLQSRALIIVELKININVFIIYFINKTTAS